MKKIGIVTLLGYFNYGNRLQNYALQETLKKLNYEVYSLRFDDEEGFLNEYSSDNITLRNKIKGIPLKKLFSLPFRKIKSSVNNSRYKAVEKNRLVIFKTFTNKFINEVDFKREYIEEFEYFIVGSDQVWNPAYIQNMPQYLLGFAPNKKRISYAASFGISKLPQEVYPTFKQELSKFKNISVREGAGSSIVENLIENEVPVLVDPTMLLNKEEWTSVSQKAKNRPESPYILTYFLGGPSDKTRKKISKIAKDNKMMVINLGDKKERETYETGPSEFLDYVSNASAFFTDSFHGTVFSIIFQTPFVVFERNASGSSMYSRIETLLSNFNMEDRQATNFKEDIFSMDFSNANFVLAKEQTKSINYLKKSLNID